MPQAAQWDMPTRKQGDTPILTRYGFSPPAVPQHPVNHATDNLLQYDLGRPSIRCDM